MSLAKCSHAQAAPVVATRRPQAVMVAGKAPAAQRLLPAHSQRQRGRQQWRQHHCVRAMIGFDLTGAEPNKNAEKHAEELCRSAASLLLYSGCLKGKPAQAFLSVLQLLQKGNPLALTQQYGELFRLLAADGYGSWMDYLLDQVIKGGDNPLAKAAACGKPTAHLHAAAEHDLNCLQQLAVADRTLATWVKDTAFGATDAWLEAASCLTPPQQFAPQPVHKALMAAEAPPPVLAAPLSEAQRAGLREKLAGAWRWGEGVELLTRYYATHGCGLVSQHRVLAWTGKLQAQDVLRGVHELQAAEESGLVGIHHHAAATLTEALTAFLRQDLTRAASPPHVAVCGGATDRWLFTAWALQRLEEQVPTELAAAAGGLRTLVVPSSQLGQGLADLAWSLSQHPRTRFAVVATAGLEKSADAAAALSGFDGFSWPPNALLIAGFDSMPSADLALVFRHIATVEDRID